MSSKYVRDTMKAHLTSTFPSETFIDMSGSYLEIQDLIAGAGITMNDTWIGLSFIGDSETPITVATSSVGGKFRELGGVYFHIVDIAKFGAIDSILVRAEAVRDSIRNNRIGKILVDSVSPPNFEAGSTLRFEGGFISASFICSYECDLDL